jgi:hypothetical protein
MMNTEKTRRSIEQNMFGWKFPTMPDAGKLGEAFKQQYELALDLADAMLAGAERLQSAQLEAAREIQAQNRKGADALAGVSDLRALMAAQGTLASTQWQAAMRQLSGMAEIVQKTNLDCARILESRCLRIGENWKDVAAAPQFAAGEMPAPWKSAFEAARVSGETMMRALTGQANWLQSMEHSEAHKAKAA